MKRVVATLILSVLTLGLAPWRVTMERRALPYLDPAMRPRPTLLDGNAMNFDADSTYRNRRCWGVRDGFLCSACYDNPRRYYAQVTVICPWDRRLCRYVTTVEENERYHVDNNQCEQGAN